MKPNNTDFEANSMPRSTLAAAGLAVTSVALLILALFLLIKFSYSYSPIEFSSVNQSEEFASSKLIVVEVSGAVVKPGVYRVEEGARVGDLLELAGGTSREADTTWTEKSINKASKVTDGSKLYIPRKGEMETSHNPSDSVNNVSGVSTISINSASQSELESLPGIGPVTASDIMNGRPYGSISELIEKKIVNQSVYEKIQSMISL